MGKESELGQNFESFEVNPAIRRLRSETLTDSQRQLRNSIHDLRSLVLSQGRDDDQSDVSLKYLTKNGTRILTTVFDPDVDSFQLMNGEILRVSKPISPRETIEASYYLLNPVDEEKDYKFTVSVAVTQLNPPSDNEEEEDGPNEPLVLQTPLHLLSSDVAKVLHDINIDCMSVFSPPQV